MFEFKIILALILILLAWCYNMVADNIQENVKESLVTLGRFHKSKLEIKYNSISTPDIKNFSEKDFRIVYHERIHFFQTIGTVLGIRGLVGEQDKIISFISLVRHLIRKGEEINIPLKKDIQKLASVDNGRFFDSTMVWKYHYDNMYCPPKKYTPKSIKGTIKKILLGGVSVGPFGPTNYLIDIPIFHIFTDTGNEFSLPFGEGMIRESMAKLYELEFNDDYDNIYDFCNRNHNTARDPKHSAYFCPLLYCSQEIPWASLQTIKYVYFVSLYFHFDILPNGIPLYGNTREEMLTTISKNAGHDLSPGYIFVEIVEALKCNPHDTVYSSDLVSQQIEKACAISKFLPPDLLFKHAKEYVDKGLDLIEAEYSFTVTGEIMTPILKETSKLINFLWQDPFNFINDLSLILFDIDKMMRPKEIYTDKVVYWNRSVPMLHYILVDLYSDLLTDNKINCIGDVEKLCQKNENTFFIFDENTMKDVLHKNTDEHSILKCSCPGYLSFLDFHLGSLKFLNSKIKA